MIKNLSVVTAVLPFTVTSAEPAAKRSMDVIRSILAAVNAAHGSVPAESATVRPNDNYWRGHETKK